MYAAVLWAAGDGGSDDVPFAVSHPPPPEFTQLRHGGVV
jgi:hypothetical protein